MKKSKKKYFQQQLAKLSEAQIAFLYNRAANFRKAAQINNRSRRNITRKRFTAKGADESMVMFEKPQKVDTLSIDDWALKVLEDEGINFIKENCPEVEPQLQAAEIKRGVIISVSAGNCVVCTGQKQWQCLLGPELTMTQKSDISTGDNVNFAVMPDDTAIVQSVYPRRSKLSRPDPTRNGVERVLAANVDIAVIVASVKKPLLKPSLIDRYLIAAQKGNIEPIICVNKVDLLKNEAERQYELEVLEPYKQINLKIVECSASTRFGIEKLTSLLKGKLCVFVGHSGTGKTSILNTIEPKIDAEVGDVHEATGLGRHTTTASILYTIDKNIRVIDTPGIREFGLWQLNPEDLKWYFDEFDEFAEDCKYANCSHTHEPDCAVKAAVEKELVSPMRYKSYLRILDTITRVNF